MDGGTEILAKLLRDEVSAHGCVRPPWVAFPGVHPFDICWRMGAGETHVMLWGLWSETHGVDEAIGVIARYDPVPADWAWWAAQASALVVEDDPYDLAFDDVRGRLASMGIEVGGQPL